MCNIPQSARIVPEPSFLYNWLASREPKQAAMLYTKLLTQHPYLANVQVRVPRHTHTHTHTHTHIHTGWW